MPTAAKASAPCLRKKRRVSGEDFMGLFDLKVWGAEKKSDGTGGFRCVRGNFAEDFESLW